MGCQSYRTYPQLEILEKDAFFITYRLETRFSHSKDAANTTSQTFLYRPTNPLADNAISGQNGSGARVNGHFRSDAVSGARWTSGGAGGASC